MTTKRDREQREVRDADMKKWNEQQGAFEATAIKTPDGFKRKKLRAGNSRLVFLPYMVGKNNPQADEGFAYFTRIWFAHSLPTLDGKKANFCCGASNFGEGKRCGCCDRVQEMIRKGELDDQEAFGFRGKSRNLFNVLDLDLVQNGIEILDVPFPKDLPEKIQDKTKKFRAYENFWKWHRGVGKVVHVTFEANKMYPNYIFAKDIEFLDPTEEEKMVIQKFLGDDPLGKSACLDTCLVETSYDKLRKLLSNGLEEATEGKEDEKELSDHLMGGSPSEPPPPPPAPPAPPPEKNGAAPKPPTKPTVANPTSDLPSATVSGGEKVVRGDYVMHGTAECEVLSISKDEHGREILHLEDENGKRKKTLAATAVRVKLKDDEKEEEEDDIPEPVRERDDSPSDDGDDPFER